MSDLISRADAIDAVRKCVVESELLADWNKAMESAQELLSALPSAETHEIRTETHGVCLISKDDAMGAVQDHFNDDGFKGYDDGQKMMDRIKALPSAEAVEIVRCRDCKWSDWYKTLNGEHRCYCMEHGSSGHTDDDYCSYGEREESEVEE